MNAPRQERGHNNNPAKSHGLEKGTNMTTSKSVNKMVRGDKFVHPVTGQHVEFVELRADRHKPPWHWVYFVGHGVSGRIRVITTEMPFEVV